MKLPSVHLLVRERRNFWNGDVGGVGCRSEGQHVQSCGLNGICGFGVGFRSHSESCHGEGSGSHLIGGFGWGFGELESFQI